MHLLAPLALLATLSSALAATVCNGQAALCSRRYSTVTFIGTHNSYSIGQNLANNQNKGVTDQLNDGVRTLQSQAHTASDGIRLCHGTCALQDGGLLTAYLSTVATWVRSNPNEVITLVIVNSDNLAASRFAAAFSTAGLDQYAFVPATPQLALNDWPTLGAMIDSGKRVVVFLDNGAESASVPYLLDEFTNMWEDPFNVVDQGFGCAVNRSKASPSTSLMMVNHYLDVTYNIAGQQLWVPARDKLNVTNAASGYGSIGAHVGNCNAIWGRNPNHILLDYYDSNANAPFSYAAQLNGVAAPTNVVVPAVTGSVSGTGSATRVGAGSATGVVGAAAVTQSRLSGAGQAAPLGLGGGAWAAAVLGAVGVALGAVLV